MMYSEPDLTNKNIDLMICTWLGQPILNKFHYDELLLTKKQKFIDIF